MLKILTVLLLVFILGGALAANEVDATAGAHANDSPVPPPAASTAPRRALTGAEVVYG